jgi:hypothetical protein
MAGKEERIFKKYGESEEVPPVLTRIKQSMSDLIESLRFRLFCKTQYLEDFS